NYLYLPRFFDPELLADQDVYETYEHELSEGNPWSSTVDFVGKLDPMQIDATDTCYRRMRAFAGTEPESPFANNPYDVNHGDVADRSQHSLQTTGRPLKTEGVRQVGGGAILSLYCGAGKTVF
ncbi:hypothetical protein SARC_16215, partial [Sphaeroforma arctica JP610]